MVMTLCHLLLTEINIYSINYYEHFNLLWITFLVKNTPTSSNGNCGWHVWCLLSAELRPLCQLTPSWAAASWAKAIMCSSPPPEQMSGEPKPLFQLTPSWADVRWAEAVISANPLPEQTTFSGLHCVAQLITAAALVSQQDLDLF